MIVSALAVARRIRGLLSPTGWAVVGLLVVFLAFGGYCARRAVHEVREEQDARSARLERNASAGRETAAGERLNDTFNTSARERERHDATASLPDTRPSDRRIARACVQLRQQGTLERDLPVVCRSAG